MNEPKEIEEISEDEDVLFENSPLHQHLKDTGLVDVMLDTEIRTLPKIQGQNRKSKTCFFWTKTVVKNLVSSLMVLLGIKFLYEDLAKLSKVFKARTLKLVALSKLLDEDDKNLLENVLKDDDTGDDVSMKPKFLFVLTLPCVMAYLYSRVNYPGLPWKYTTLTDISASLCLIYLLFIIAKSCLLCYMKWLYNKQYSGLELLVRQGSSLCRCLRKSLCLIQESEMVARGFTLVSQQNLVWRLERNTLHNTQRQCPQLRSILFCTSRQCMLIAKEKTLQLLNLYPLGTAVDGVLRYLANVPLAEYGPCVQIKGDTSDLYHITDGFSVAALKGMKQLCELQLSELLRRLALTVCHTETSKDIKILNEFVASLTEKLGLETEVLCRSYESHSCCLLDKNIKQPRATPNENPSPLREVYMIVHSLDLHLQAAWLRVKSLSTMLEHQVDHDENNTEELLSEDTFNGLQEQIKQELLACKACWEEGINCLEKLQKKPNQSAGEMPELNPTLPTESQDNPPPVAIFDIGDPVIEDQVFEAYIEEDSIESGVNSWEEFITPEEKARQKKEKQEAVRVLTELKSVISVRAVEREHRERIALEKVAKTSQQIPSTTDSMNSGLICQYTEPSGSCETQLNWPCDSLDITGKKSDLSGNWNLPKYKPAQEEPSHCQKTNSASCSHNGKYLSTSVEEANQILVKNTTSVKDLSHRLVDDKVCGDVVETHIVKEEIADPVLMITTDEARLLSSGENCSTTVSGETSLSCKQYGQEDYSLSDAENSDFEFSDRVPTVFKRYRASSGEQWCPDSDTADKPANKTVKDKLSRLSGTNIMFTSNLAAMLAARSQGMALTETTFGDDDSDVGDDT